MRSLRHFFFVLALGTTAHAVAQTSISAHSVPRLPVASTAGVVLTDGPGHRLFLLQGDSLRQLSSSAGCGTYHALAPDGLRLGFKSLSSAGQAPAVLDLTSGTTTLLHPPAARVGQVSFARDGLFGFTVGDTLIVAGGGRRRAFNLGTYANIAPLSPDGKHVAFNDEDDQLFLLSLDTGARIRLTDGSGAYAFPQWSPAGTHLLFSSLRGDLWLYNVKNGTKTALGEGFSPAWSHDGRRLIFYRKTIVNDVLVDTDLFVASPDGTVRQLTSTPNLCEVDASFARDDKEILFQSLSDKGIYAVAFEEAGV